VGRQGWVVRTEFSLDRRLVVDLVACAYIALESISFASPLSMDRVAHLVSLRWSAFRISHTTLFCMATPII